MSFFSKKQKPKEFIENIVQKILDKAELSLSYELLEKDGGFFLDIFGEDEGLLKTRQAKLLIALQTFLSRALQNKFSEEKIKIEVDSSGYWEEKREKLLLITDKLKERVMEEQRALFFKYPMTPKERKQVHEYVSQDLAFKSQSIGEGFLKKVKILPNKG